MATLITLENSYQPFRLLKSTRGGNKIIEGGFIYGQQSRAGEVTHIGSVSEEESAKRVYIQRACR